MNIRFTSWAALTLLAGGLQGCGSTTPNWDSRFGAATRANLAAQTIAPGAASNDPATGIDGRAARAAYDNYQRSFAQPDNGRQAPLVGER